MPEKKGKKCIKYSKILKRLRKRRRKQKEKEKERERKVSR